MADAYEDMANFEGVSGYRATAARHLALAHQLRPNDQSIRLAWLSSLPFDQRIEEYRKYLENSKAIDEKRRDAITASFDKSTATFEDRCELVSSTGPARIPMVPMTPYLEDRTRGVGFGSIVQRP